MHHRVLPQELRERVRRYDQYKWLETRGVDEESIVGSLPKDLRRDIKRHLCLNLVRRVSINIPDLSIFHPFCNNIMLCLVTRYGKKITEILPIDLF